MINCKSEVLARLKTYSWSEQEWDIISFHINDVFKLTGVTKMNDISMDMLRDHPIQKEWKPKNGAFYVDEGVGFVATYCNCCVNGGCQKDYNPKECTIWLPTQEDWQEKYRQHNATEFLPTLINKILEVFYEAEGQFLPNVAVASSLDTIEKDRRLRDAQVLWNRNQNWTVLWCLLVSKEVYNIKWRWEEKKWVKA